MIKNANLQGWSWLEKCVHSFVAASISMILYLDQCASRNSFTALSHPGGLLLMHVRALRQRFLYN